MNTNTQNITNSFLLENKKSLVVLFILFLLSSTGMFGQNRPVVSNPANTIEVTTLNISQAVALDSNADFMSWFMGSKSTQNFQESTSDNAASLSARKKQIISSGVTPNKVLYRTFVKKIISQENVIV